MYLAVLRRMGPRTIQLEKHGVVLCFLPFARCADLVLRAMESCAWYNCGARSVVDRSCRDSTSDNMKRLYPCCCLPQLDFTDGEKCPLEEKLRGKSKEMVSYFGSLPRTTRETAFFFSASAGHTLEAEIPPEGDT